MAVKLDPLTLADQYNKEIVGAKKKGGNKAGGRMVTAMKRQARKNLKKTSPRYLAGIRKSVSKTHGNLTLLSLAPPSVALEDGATLTPKGSRFFAVPWTGEEDRFKARALLRAAKQTFVIRAKSGRLILFSREPGLRGGTVRDARPLATLLERVVIPKKLDLRGEVASRLGEYAEAVEAVLLDPRASKG